MALILNIESSTDICSICLSDKEAVVALNELQEGYIHSERITLLIAACMEQSGYDLRDIDAVALSEGPGSYTSLRVGSSVAKGICYALDKPLIAINTLQSLALASLKEEKIDNAIYIPMIDARRMEVYTATFNANNDPISEVEAKILDETSTSNWNQSESPIVICGNGMKKSQELLTGANIIFSNMLCSATHMVDLAYKSYQNNAFTDHAYFSPKYFKAPNITVSKKKTL